jgi:membrane protein DedA with SNARE-associated domain
MARHGGKTVFVGRFVSILRYTVAWVAGLSSRHWWEKRNCTERCVTRRSSWSEQA